MQIRSRELLKPKKSILSNGNTFFISLNFGVRFMILRPVDTSFLRLEKLRYYDENRIFPSEAILKHKQVGCVRRKMPFTFIKYLFSFQRYSSF